jgi:hypothetical protein
MNALRSWNVKGKCATAAHAAVLLFAVDRAAANAEEGKR